MNTPPNGQKIRSLATQTALMEAAETLIAENGIQNVSNKEIVREAGQKNQSALQYHFRNLQGLVNAVHRRRSRQIHKKRSEMLAELASAKGTCLRDLCGLMVYPTFLLARSDRQFRQYVIAFNHEVVLAETFSLSKVSRPGGGGIRGTRLGELLRHSLCHFDERTYRARMDLTVRICSATIGSHLRQKQPLKGAAADFFINNLIDSLEGLLSAPVSRDTQRSRKQSS